MKKTVSKVGLVAGTALVFAGISGVAQAAPDWGFSGSPTAGGWYYDTTTRKSNQTNTRFNLQFVKSLVSTSGGKLICKSGNYPQSGTSTAKGGGIRHNTAFSTGRIAARCRMVANGSTSGSSGGGSNSLAMQIKRSQASFWLEPNGKLTHEIDFFELKPNKGIVCNFIKWKNNVRSNIGLKDWGGANEAGSWAIYKCFRSGNKFNCYRNSEKVTFTKLSGYAVGTKLNIHNKPWRYSNVYIPGKVASLQCDWIDKR